MNGDGRAGQGQAGGGAAPFTGAARPEALSSAGLLREIGREVQHLVKAQVALAKVELRGDVAREARTAVGLGVSALAALTTVNLLLVTAILALAAVLPAWAAGLVVSGATAVAATVSAVLGWRKRVRRPLSRTRHELGEDARWTKEHVT
jgi:uncharacterized membrane protein YqjE